MTILEEIQERSEYTPTTRGAASLTDAADAVADRAWLLAALATANQYAEKLERITRLAYFEGLLTNNIDLDTLTEDSMNALWVASTARKDNGLPK